MKRDDDLPLRYLECLIFLVNYCEPHIIEPTARDWSILWTDWLVNEVLAVVCVVNCCCEEIVLAIEEWICCCLLYTSDAADD